VEAPVSSGVLAVAGDELLARPRGAWRAGQGRVGWRRVAAGLNGLWSKPEKEIRGH
jgi:hypothetical protein